MWTKQQPEKRNWQQRHALLQSARVEAPGEWLLVGGLSTADRTEPGRPRRERSRPGRSRKTCKRTTTEVLYLIAGLPGMS